MLRIVLLMVLSTSPVQADQARDARIAQLIEQLGDSKFRVRDQATQQLIAIGRPAVAALRQAVQSNDLEIRSRVRFILEKIQTTIEFLIDDLKSTDSETRRHAAEGLMKLGPQAKAAMPVLLEMLRHRDESVRELALGAALAIDPENKGLANLVPARAHVAGKYGKLLRRIHVPQDRDSYSEFRDYGQYRACDYAGHQGIPAGFWVYVYPHWYIWGEARPGR